MFIIFWDLWSEAAHLDVMTKGVDLHSQALSKGTGQSQAP